MNYVKYSVNGETVYLENINGVWQQSLKAPEEAGIYNLALEVSINGNTTYIDSGDSRYDLRLNVLNEYDNYINLLDYLPEFIADIKEFQIIMDIESEYFNRFYGDISNTLDNNYLETMSIEVVQRFETFLGILGEGTLIQRKNYLKALFKKGNKLNENTIRTIISTITGSKALIKFYSGSEIDAPITGQGVLKIQVLSPDPLVNYKFNDIIRAISPLMPEHIKLIVIKYFATWGDIQNAYSSWEGVKNEADWATVLSYIPPNEGS
jgi:hypothetical protein